VVSWHHFSRPSGISRGACGYTNGMKTAISIPDEVFQEAEKLARRTKKSRSQLFSDAMREYLRRHAPDEITEAMDRACAGLDSTKDEFLATAAQRTLERNDW
jgi:predicted transcriptional regulator